MVTRPDRAGAAAAAGRGLLASCATARSSPAPPSSASRSSSSSGRSPRSSCLGDAGARPRHPDRRRVRVSSNGTARELDRAAEPPAPRRRRPDRGRARRGPRRRACRCEQGLTPDTSNLNQPWWIDVIKAFVVINLVMLCFAYVTWLERKLLGRMQLRYGPNRAGPFGLLQPIADLVKLIRKESFFPAGGDRPPLHRRARRRRVHGARSPSRSSPAARSGTIGDYDVTGWVADVSIALHPDLRARLDRHLRLHRRRLGERLEVLAPRLDAHVRADRLLRGLARALRARRRDHGPARSRSSTSSTSSRRRSGSPGPQFVGLARLLRRRRRRDEPAAVRPARGRVRARRRLPHRVQRHALGPLPDGRVRQHDHALRARGDALLRRLGRPRAARPDLVPDQARRSRCSSSSGCARRCRACATTS